MGPVVIPLLMGIAAAVAGCAHDTDILGSPDVHADTRPDTAYDPIDTHVPDTWPPDVPDVPDECPDSDRDGVCDVDDRCPGHDDALDADVDGVPDGCDRCLGGDDRIDTDGDGTPDRCDCDHAGIACGANAFCFETGGGVPLCICNPGYEGDGFTCTDIDECARGTAGCDPHATCTNTPGGFTCTCDEGYSGDGFVCVPVDHCAAGTHLCDLNATCTYTGPGTYDCACNAGYLGDGYTCTPIDPDICVSANDGPLYDDSSSVTGTGILLAMRFMAPTRLRVSRCEVFTGEATGTGTLGLWSHDYTTDRPYRNLGTGSWPMLVPNQWQGVVFSPLLDLGGGPDYWLVWGPVRGAQSSVHAGGAPVESRVSLDGGSSWGAPSAAPLKLRCTCD